jgi:hypothetical protein
MFSDQSAARADSRHCDDSRADSTQLNGFSAVGKGWQTIRTGISRAPHKLFPPMPFAAYRNITADDMAVFDRPSAAVPGGRVISLQRFGQGKIGFADGRD